MGLSQKNFKNLIKKKHFKFLLIVSMIENLNFEENLPFEFYNLIIQNYEIMNNIILFLFVFSSFSICNARSRISDEENDEIYESLFSKNHLLIPNHIGKYAVFTTLDYAITESKAFANHICNAIQDPCVVHYIPKQNHFTGYSEASMLTSSGSSKKLEEWLRDSWVPVKSIMVTNRTGVQIGNAKTSETNLLGRFKFLDYFTMSFEFCNKKTKFLQCVNSKEYERRKTEL